MYAIRSYYAQVTAVVGEKVANVGRGAVFVVGKHLDQDRDAAGTVTFVQEFLEGGGAELAGTLFA